MPCTLIQKKPMNRFFKLSLSSTLCAASLAAGAVTFEDWSTSTVSTGGTFDGAGNFYITDSSKRWAVNNWDTTCNANMPGPNGCYAPSTSNNRLYLHAEKGATGDGFLFASVNQISFTNGMTLEVPITPLCYQAASPNTTAPNCGWNIGIYESEYNYRSLGVRSDNLGGGGIQLNIWGPCFEANFDGVDHPSATAALPSPTCSLGSYDPPAYTSVPTPAGGTYVLKMQYWNSSGTWRWDYFLNGTWVAGHPANTDNAFYLGPGHYPGKAARIQLGAFSYSLRPGSWPSGTAWNAAEGYFGPVTYTTF